MRSWFIFAHVVDEDEKKEFDRIFKKCRKNLDNNTSVYILRIYSKKLANVYHITSEKQTIVLKSQQKDLTRRRWISSLVNFVKRQSEKNKDEIKALSYYGHGGSVVIGKWQDPLLGVSQFTNYVIKPFGDIKLITMDSCYMGGLTSMYEVSAYCKFAAASPSWHPDLSVSSLKAFGKLPKSDDDETWKNYTKSLSCEFKITGRKPKYSCFMPIDLRNLRKIVNKIKVLNLTKDSVLKLNDPQQFDLYLSVPDEKIRSQLKDIIISKTCMSECPKRINGISVREPDPSDAWHEYFVKTEWSRVLKNIKIVNDETIEKEQEKKKTKKRPSKMKQGDC